MDPKLVMPLLLGAALIWALYRRVRRTFGRQPISAARLGLRAGLLAVAGLAVLARVVHDTALLGWLVGGVAAGALLALISLQHTRFELERGERYYTPHAYIGIIILALFLSRVLFRFVTLYAHGAPDPAAMQTDGRSPLTLLSLGGLIGYYLFYSLGVLRRSRNLVPKEPQDLTT